MTLFFAITGGLMAVGFVWASKLYWQVLRAEEKWLSTLSERELHDIFDPIYGMDPWEFPEARQRLGQKGS